MEIYSLVLLAIGLSFDSFAASVSTGITNNDIRFKKATYIALVMAFFQGIFPVAGWFIGDQLRHIIQDYDHWVAFVLLLIIGLKMLYESFANVENSDQKAITPIFVIGMAIATSIDSLIVGLSFGFISFDIIKSAIVIAFFTYLMSMLGMLFGKNAGVKFGKRLEIAGGLIIILIGFKILIDDLLL